MEGSTWKRVYNNLKLIFFKALAHPLRIRILELLVDGKKSVNEIQSCLEKEGSAVSQQLSVLRTKNIVYGTKEGKKSLLFFE